MVIYHQTFSPSTCDCVIEQQFEHDEETGLNGDPTLWFFHSVCPKHEPLVKNKPKLKAADLQKKRDEIENHHSFLLTKNRERHLKDFDEHPSRKQRVHAIKELIKSVNTERRALTLDAKMQAERVHQERFLDGHEEESMNHLLTGLYSPYALVSQKVYDTIMQEQKDG